MLASYPMPRRKALPVPMIEEDQYERLHALAQRALNRLPDVAQFLLDELERAQIAPKPGLRSGTVTMGTRVRFEDLSTGRMHDVRLVYPEEADISTGRISVLTPVGAALLGLRKGQRMTWTTPGGEVRGLKILGVGEIGGNI